MSNPKNYDHTHLDQNPKEWKPQRCIHPSHEPPNMMVIPIEGYTHICPCCGKKTRMQTNRPIM